MFLDINQQIITKASEIRFHEILNMSEREDLNLKPDYKIGLIWNLKLKSRFVESALLGLPLNGFVFEENDYGNFSVVDGTERLSSIIEFIKGNYALSGLTILRELNGLCFQELDYNYQTKIERAFIGVIIIDRESSPSLKAEYFKRLNTTKNGFVSQQARNFAYPKAYGIISSGRRLLAKSFNFRISNQSFGVRKFNSILKEEHFVLCLTLLEYIKEQKIEYDYDSLLGNVLDHLSQVIEKNNDFYLGENIIFNINNILSRRGVKSLNLVNRSYSSSKKYREDEMSMNDFLLIYYRESFISCSESTNLRFDFFDESINFNKILRCL